MTHTNDNLKQYNITVVGIGYVGLSNAVLLARRNCVTVIDIDEGRLEAISNGISTIQDEEIEEYLAQGTIELRVTGNTYTAYSSADFVLVCVPTDFDEDNQTFDTSNVVQVVKEVTAINADAVIVIKSTVPIGFTEKISETVEGHTVLFNPEFLREGHALYDNLHPSRIIVGHGKGRRASECAALFAAMLSEAAEEKDVPVMITGQSEAEAIKLFSNTYLAARIAFFNELDMFSEQNGLNARQIIEGMGFDQRIGMLYNNPSFGYGGYCLPKDTRQLLSQFRELPQSMIGATIRSNQNRIGYVADRIAHLAIKKDLKPSCIGIYRIIAKADSDNFRESSTVKLMSMLSDKGFRIVVYEPILENKHDFDGFELVKDFNVFCEMSDLIVANRSTQELSGAKQKVYTRDIYSTN